MEFFKKTFLNSSEDQKEDDQSEIQNKDESDYKESVIGTILSSISLGMDIFKTGIPMPTQFHEPMTILQRTAEMMAYSDLLKKAANEDDPSLRMAYVVAYVISGFIGSERTYIDFNPFLGETFEWIDPNTDAKVIVEQVSSNPPISAFHAESEDFVIRQNVHVKSTFLGNSVDLEPQGRTYIFIKKTGDIYFYKSPKIRIHNIILGTTWLENYGELEIKNIKTNDSCIIDFQKSSLFGSKRYDISGKITDSKGEEIVLISGNWNRNAMGKWLVDTQKCQKGLEIMLWCLQDDFFIGGKYNLSKYAAMLLDCNENHPEQIIAPTDSRLRLDRRALSNANFKKASEYKKMLEEKYRNEMKEREQKRLGWEPVYFRKEKCEDINEELYIYVGRYWEKREEKIRQIESGAPFTEEPLCDNKIKGLTCDFRQFKLEVESKESIL